MIIGIGTDLCQISRMSELLTDKAFLKRYFDEREQAYILSRGIMAAASMAGHFAAKEAFAKALGSGFYGVKPEDIGVRHNDKGAPFFELKGSALLASLVAGVDKAYLSISHEGGLALALAVLEGK